MAFVQIETSVPRHRKFLRAGPAACWLWVCGLTYCQDGLTDGFIPREAIQALGLNVSRSALRDAIAKLVEVKLWEVTADGWQLHDYLKHNNSAAHVLGIKETNTKNAKARRRPRATRSDSVSESVSESLSDSLSMSSSEPVYGYVSGSGSVSEKPSEKELSPEQIGDEFQRFQMAYHPAGRRGGPLPFGYFERARQGGVTLAAMLDALENHKHSAQWLAGKVPSLVTWLQDQWWMTRLDPPKAPEGATDGLAALRAQLAKQGAL